jgi:hypothetical protein
VIAAFAALMRGHGFTVYTIGDQAHLTADPPEDHTPYSHTPWPGPQPYPEVLALDVMPGGPVDWRALGGVIIQDRAAGGPGTDWIKYANVTDLDGRCWHYRWEPDLVVTPSSDTGHIHLSARTDRVDDQLHGWDPVAELLGTPPVTHPQGDDMLTHWTTVHLGSTGDPVRAAQALLSARHAGDEAGRPLVVDGDFGPHTEAATRNFQRAHPPLQVDGQFGPHTLSVALYGREVTGG